VCGDRKQGEEETQTLYTPMNKCKNNKIKINKNNNA
jgi:hypothetical protein